MLLERVFHVAKLHLCRNTRGVASWSLRGVRGGEGMGACIQSIVRERINITEVFSLQLMFSESWLVVTPRPEMPVLNESVFYDPPLDGAILCADRI
jgi:hypothetical protein